MATLKTDYVNDVLDTDVNEERTYNLVDANGNIIYESVRIRETTALSTVGDDYGALEINEQNTEINNKTNKTTINEYTLTPSNLAQFVQGTATGNLMTSFKILDTNNVLGFGNQWVKGYIQYQNAYDTQWDVNGMGIASIQGGNPIFIKITGTGTSFTVTRRDLTQDTNTVTDFTVVVATVTYNIGASEIKVINFTPTIPSGYTPIGIVGFKTGGNSVVPITVGSNNDGSLGYRLDVVNAWSVAYTNLTAKIRVLCMKKS